MTPDADPAGRGSFLELTVPLKRRFAGSYVHPMEASVGVRWTFRLLRGTPDPSPNMLGIYLGKRANGRNVAWCLVVRSTGEIR